MGKTQVIFASVLSSPPQSSQSQSNPHSTHLKHSLSLSTECRRKPTKQSYAAEVESSIPNHNDSISAVLSTFQSMGIDTQGTVALLGAHSVGRVHCINLVQRLYPTVDPSLDPEYAEYLKARCPSPHPDPNAVLYSRNDRETPMVLDNMYYKNILGHKGLLAVDQQLLSDPNTYPFVEKMAADNGYFHDQDSKCTGGDGIRWGDERWRERERGGSA